MSVEVRMPQMGESITEGTVVRWFKQLGDRVERDEPLLEISTDKVDTEVPSPAAGFLAAQLVEEGATVPVDTHLCTLTAENPANTATEAATAAPPASSVGAAADVAVLRAAHAATSVDPAAPQEGDRPRLSPAVRRLLREHGVEATQVTGTGSSGRITRQDVEAYLAGRSSDPAAPASTAPGSNTADRIEPISIMRRKIAENMVRSRQTSAHVWSLHEVDMTAARGLRDRLRPEWIDRGVKLTYTAFMVQAVAKELRAHPILNATLDTERGEICYKGEVNVGVAVALDDDEGILVPVVRRADELTVFEIARRIADLAERARNKTLDPEDVQDGTFTITNIGVFGSLTGVPIISQPQVAILCMGTVQKRVMVIDDTEAIAVRSMCYVSMSFDHRLIDGAVGDRFQAGVRRRMENLEFDLE